MSGPRVRGAAQRYDRRHRAIRDQLLAQLAAAGQLPCPQTWADGTICGAPMRIGMALDLGHDDYGNVIGLTHRFCNRSAAQQKQVILEKAKRQPQQRRGLTARPW